MLLGVIADDYTGASDIANTLARGAQKGRGLRTVQFLGVPQGQAPKDVEAGVVALKSRSVPAAEAVAQSLDALAWLRRQGCRQIVFKYCSTFDSTPKGNIGPVAEALARALDAWAVVVCSAMPAAGRTVYQGHLFVGDRLLSESGMENHPLTPMTDPDLRRWLRLQTDGEVGLVPLQTVAAGRDAITAALAQAGRNEQRLVIVDAASAEDLLTIGQAITEATLATGGSGIALGLPENFIAQGLASGSDGVDVRVSGAEAILAGSCSGATRGQIEVHCREHPSFRIDVDAVMSGRQGVDDIASFLLSHSGREPIVYSSGDPEDVKRMQVVYGRQQVAARLDALFAGTAAAVVDRGVRRLVVAGGETSGAVVQALGIEALAVGGEIDPGVPVLGVSGQRPLALALKSGNFGGSDFFSRALKQMDAP